MTSAAAIAAAGITLWASGNAGTQATLTETPFVQEFSEHPTLAEEAGARDVASVAVESSGTAWAAARAGLYRLESGAAQWARAGEAGASTGPVFDVVPNPAGGVWAGAWNGLYRARRNVLEKIEGIDAPLAALCRYGDAVLVAGPDGLWRVDRDGVTHEPLPGSREVRALCLAPDASGSPYLWIATAFGLYGIPPVRSSVKPIRLQAPGGLLSADVQGVARGPAGALWAAGLGGVVIHAAGSAPALLASTLPSIDVRCVAQGPDGGMWVGTAAGVARFDGPRCSVLRSRRWLLDDRVRRIAFGPDGSAWVATAGGVSVVRAVKLTLAQKAERYLEACMARHVRDPGLVEKCRLRVPGDLTTWEPEDDDNDGQYTAMYLAMQSYRFAVTRDPKAREAARRAFGALRFLQTVTGTRGFVARSVVPSTWTRWADPNEVISDADWAVRRVRNPREKRVETHWRPSADGRWLWKCGTSSDEITGHMFGYLAYHDLAAEASDRRDVAEHVGRIVDAIVDGGFLLRDVDGQPTEWGVWAPAKLNDDPDWEMDRGVNSVEMLSFLKLAAHVTGDTKYEATYRRLIRDHHYAENARRPKTLNPSWRTHIDDELLALAFPALLLHEKDPELLALYREGVESWHEAVKAEHSPYFDFTHAALSGNRSGLEGAFEFLRDAPLDLVRWEVDNTRREDIRLVRAPELEHVQTDRLLPPSERCTTRWDDNPWIAVQGDGGRTESDGVFWLLPYWMGRYYGLLD